MAREVRYEYLRPAEIVEELEIIRSHVSLSHAQDHAVAFVVLEVCGTVLGASAP